MRTVVLGEPPAELAALIARRRAHGHDLFDEVWYGEYHVAPPPNASHSDLQAQFVVLLQRLGEPAGLRTHGPFNLGSEEANFRVPDVGVLRSRLDQVWIPTAAMVVEIVSPHGESWLKFDHYAAHDVDEVLIADPATSSLHLFVLADGRYEPADRSAVLDVTAAGLHAAIDWPGSR